MKRHLVLTVLISASIAVPVSVLSTNRVAGHATTAATSKESSTTAKPAAHHGWKLGGSRERIDINTATKEELMKLPGITDTMADQIIAGRPYKAKADLTAKKVITKEEFSKIANRVTVKRAATTK